MCGINGFTWEDENLINQMNRKTEHRGPDGTRRFLEQGISLGHNRLAIIDLDPRSSQPMESADGRYVIVFNGEIYNYRELKAELPLYPYKTEGDTEVILAAYAAWGTASFSRLSGIFAFGIWDRKEKKLIVARDHAGVKPLYFMRNEKGCAFSSELSALLPLSGASLDHEALDLYFSLLYVPHERTLVRDVKKLGAGMYLTCESGAAPRIERYRTTPQPEAEGVTKETVRRTIGGAVGAQLVSDRPVGVFLSGGFDSSIVLHHVMEHTGKAQTFTTGFELPEADSTEYEKFNADMYLARKTAVFYGTTHHEQLISLATVRDSLEEVFLAVDEPIANSANVPSYHLSKFAREHVVVALDGSGGDELFGGYDWYRLNRIAAYYKMLPLKVQHTLGHAHPLLHKMSLDSSDYYLASMGQEPDVLRRMVPGRDPHATARTYIEGRYGVPKKGETFLERMMDIHRTLWLVDESLTRTDKLGMAHGLEIRVPLLDTAVEALAARIPAPEKASFFTTKRPLKNAYRGVLPEHVYGQPKRGWFPPGAKWLRDPGIERALRSILSPGYYTGTSNLFDWDAVESMMDDHIARRGYYFKPLWALATFQVWARKHNIRA